MARKRIYNHIRFDGGMTHDNRNTSDLSKSSFISHIDIYRENHRAYVMPGFESVNGFDENENGIKLYDLRAFSDSINVNHIYGLGTRSDGTGSKIFMINDKAGATQWTAGGDILAVEGAGTITTRPFLVWDNPKLLYPINNAGILNIATNGVSSYDTYAPTGSPIQSADRYTVEKGFNGTVYVSNPSLGGLRSITRTALTSAKTVSGSTYDHATGDYTIGIVQFQADPIRGSVVIWDAASLLADQNVRLKNVTPTAIGYVKGSWVIGFRNGINDSSSTSGGSNGQSTFGVIVISGETPHRIWEYRCFPATVYTESDQFAIKGEYNGAMLFYTRVATTANKSSFLSGIFAAGSNNINSPIGVSQLLNTESLGIVENAYNFGSRFYFAHNSDGSISRLQRFDTGTYDIPGYIETLFYGADSPHNKTLEGISVVTENLPSGASVEVQYRKDENDSWVSLGVSNTTDKQVHNFTRVAGVPIGKFREIQFKIIINGKVILKSYLVSITEEDDLSFST